MDLEVEKQIVEAFIVNRKKERAIYELSSKKKRSDFIWRMGSVLDRQYMQLVQESVTNYDFIYRLLQKHGAPELVYVLSSSEDDDGKFLSLEKALEKTVHWGPALISCIPGKLAYWEEESDWNSKRYLLIRK